MLFIKAELRERTTTQHMYQKEQVLVPPPAIEFVMHER